MPRITLPTSCMIGIIPNVENIGYLPRKKKKALKNKLAAKVLEILRDSI